jgi:hypothetical protein
MTNLAARAIRLFLNEKPATGHTASIAPYQLVLVTWEDSATPISQWQWVSEYAIPEIVRCVSVGFLIAETEAAIAIAPNLGGLDQDEHQACGIIRIPRSAIKSLAEI